MPPVESERIDEGADMPRTGSKSSATSAWCETEAPTVTHGGNPPERREGMTASSASMHPLDGWLADLIERTARETAEQTALRTVEKVQATLRTQTEDRQCNAGQAALLLGYSKPDGSPNLPAFKMYRERNRDFGNLGRKIGSRWYWQRSDIEGWIKAHPRGGKVSDE